MGIQFSVQACVDTNDRSRRLAIAMAVAEASRDGVILRDSDGRALHRNQIAVDLLARTPDRPAVEAAIEELAAAAIRCGEPSRLALNGFAIRATIHHCSSDYLTIITIQAKANSQDETELRARFGFSRREAEVAALLARRLTDAEIASELGISWHTVRSHVERVFTILGCRNRRQAADQINGKGGERM
jgi:DNA-binding CsgD family transcriptional regulator